MQDFTKKMVALLRRDSAADHVGDRARAKPDAQKEFDRTVDYIKATIDALKQLDNS